MKLLSVVVLLLAPALTSGIKKYPRDCSVIHQDKSQRSGVFTIYPDGPRSAVQVYCDMDSLRGGWTVFQRRMDGSVNFYRPWDQYRTGFGSAAGEYWLGLDNIHHLTKGRKVELLVQMEDFEGKSVFARYTSFSVGGECDGYLLKVSGFINGGAGDGLKHHNGQKFTTFDKDQDVWGGNCAKSFLGAFWYGKCHATNPNGVYRWGADKTLYAVGVEWAVWKGHDYSLKSIRFKIRPVH
uniref:Microfibril-associated glycoprotein 4-like n=1 Tax=Sparus aurata TaxID=8175 RepID=A0A671VQK7_SPAAU